MDTAALTNEAIWHIEGTTTNRYKLARAVDVHGRNAGYSLRTAGVPPAPLQAVGYGYDSLGRFSAVTSTVDTVTSTFAYDWMDSANLLNGYSIAGVSPALSVDYG